ncbi:MAG: pyridoxamine 5'-phosphate oxidase family protein [Candidatus Dormiibacterota bacterium]
MYVEEPMIKLPPQVDEFLHQPNGAVMGCLRPDGFPMTVVTWYDWEAGRILINMDQQRNRLRWIRANPKVSLTVFDKGWHRHVSLHGLVVEIRDDIDLADIDRLARRYTEQPFWSRTAKRVSAWIEPAGWHGYDESGELSSERART